MTIYGHSGPFKKSKIILYIFLFLLLFLFPTPLRLEYMGDATETKNENSGGASWEKYAEASYKRQVQYEKE